MSRPPRREISWTELGIAFVSLFAAVSFQALGGWWHIPGVLCIIVTLICVAD